MGWREKGLWNWENCHGAVGSSRGEPLNIRQREPLRQRTAENWTEGAKDVLMAWQVVLSSWV